MAGYSGKPLSEKIGLKSGHRVSLIDAPAAVVKTLQPLPKGVHIGRAGDAADVALLFCHQAVRLTAAFAPTMETLRPGGMIWVAWPKKASRQPTDLDENVVRRIGLAAGMVDVKVCAIDEVWSGLKFVRRRAPRA